MRHQGTPGQLGGPGQRRLEYVVGGHDPVHQPHGQRLVRRHAASRHDELLCSRRTDEARQPLRPAAPGQDPQQHLGEPERGVFGAHPEIASQGQLESSAQGVPVDGGDGGARHAGQRPERAGEVRPHPVGRGAVPLDDVGPGGEDPPPSPQHDRPGRVLGQRGGDGEDLAEYGSGERVHLGSVEADQGDAVRPALEGHERCGHSVHRTFGGARHWRIIAP